MELNLQKLEITSNDIVFHETLEQAIECDGTLPDYQPDIAKILKCAISTGIGLAAQNGKAVTVEGLAVIHIYYLSENEGIRRCEYKVPFTRDAELPRAAADPVITVMPSVDYVNCRAVSGRRVDVRGSLSLAVKVSERGKQEIISGAEGGGIQLYQQMVKLTELSGQSEHVFSLGEELELAYGKPAIGHILRSDLRVNVHDSKIISGKVVAKADLVAHVTYVPQDRADSLELMDYTLPLSQIIDADGVDEDTVCDVLMHALSFDIQPKADDVGEYRMLSLEARIRAVVIAHRHQEIPVTSDCYSTEYASSCKQQPVSFLCLEKILREVIMHRASLDLPEGVTEVMDVWCDVEATQWSQEQEELTLALRLTVSMFARLGESGEILYFEQATELEQRFSIKCSGAGKLLFEPSCDIFSCTYGLTGQENMEVRCEISVRGCIYRSFRQPSVGEIGIDEASPHQKDRNKLILYYADPGESVWDIAKRYHTSANAIWAENEIGEDQLAGSDRLIARRMLMIPIA